MEQLKPKETGILSKFSLEDRIAIVTGSGSGLGKGIALALAQDGAHIVVAELDASTGEATAEEVRALGRKALPIVVDVLNSEHVKGLVDKTMAEFGRIDILVNNIGGTSAARKVSVLDMREDEWDAILRRNLKGTFLCSKEVSKVMIDQGKGNIINISSRAAWGPYPIQAPYGVAKAGINHFTQTLAVQLAPYNIRVNAIAPGVIAAPGYQGDRDERARTRGVPLGRAVPVEDFGLAAIYLASDASNNVTGITLEVTGGPSLGAKVLEEAKGIWQAQKTP